MHIYEKAVILNPLFVKSKALNWDYNQKLNWILTNRQSYYGYKKDKTK